MKIDLPDETIRSVEAVIAERGADGNVSTYIDRTVKRALFFDTARQVRQRNADLAPDELQQLIDNAVEEVRTESGGVYPSADRS